MQLKCKSAVDFPHGFWLRRLTLLALRMSFSALNPRQPSSTSLLYAMIVAVASISASRFLAAACKNRGLRTDLAGIVLFSPSQGDVALS